MKNKQGFTLVEIMIVVVIIGLLAAMAIPAFNQVRQNSRASAIENNLRQIASAGQQFLLENGDTDVPHNSLVDVYFSTISTVAGEDYTSLNISEEGGFLIVSDNGGTEYTYAY